jgi:hypothetical protein
MAALACAYGPDIGYWIRTMWMKAMIRYRATLLQRVVVVLGGLTLGLAFGYVLIVTHGGTPSRAEITQVLIALPVATLVSLISWPGYGITLTPESAIIHLGRERVMDWRRVADISVENEFGFRFVVIRGLDGKRVRLYAPIGFLDREFDEKVKVVRAYWQGQSHGV